MRDTLAAVLAHKGAGVHCVVPGASVLDAVRKMNRERIGSLLVRDGTDVVGIFSERDVLCRVLDAGLDPGGRRSPRLREEHLVADRRLGQDEERVAVVVSMRVPTTISRAPATGLPSGPTTVPSMVPVLWASAGTTTARQSARHTTGITRPLMISSFVSRMRERRVSARRSARTCAPTARAHRLRTRRTA